MRILEGEIGYPNLRSEMVVKLVAEAQTLIESKNDMLSNDYVVKEFGTEKLAKRYFQDYCSWDTYKASVKKSLVVLYVDICDFLNIIPDSMLWGVMGVDGVVYKNQLTMLTKQAQVKQLIQDSMKEAKNARD